MNKKVLTTIAAVMFVAVSAFTVYAFGPGSGFGPYGINNPQGTAMSPEQLEKFNKFQQDVLPLRQKMYQLKTELAALMSQPNPDYKAIADKQKQMVDVRVEIQKKANEAGITAPCGGRGMGRGGCIGVGVGNPAGFKAGKRGAGIGYGL